MTDILELIKRDIEDDISIKTNNIKIEIKTKGLLRRKKQIHIFGSIPSEREKEKVTLIAEHHAGDRYDVVNDMAIE